MARFADMPIPVQFFLAFVTVLGLIGAIEWAVRRRSARGLRSWLRFAGTPRSSQSRLTVIDYANVGGRRRLVLVRRDDVEHLMLIGGATDVVVESNITAGPLQPAVAVLHRAEKAPEQYSGDAPAIIQLPRNGG